MIGYVLEMNSQQEVSIVCPTKRVVEMALVGIQDIPTLPSVFQQTQQLLHSEKTSAQDIAKIISEDLSLTTKILKSANSAYYSTGNVRVSSIQQAIVRLGFNEICRLCSFLAIVEKFKGMGKNLDHANFWKHSLASGLTAQYIHRLVGKDTGVDDNDLYVAGLLHDLGILIMDQFFPQQFTQITEQFDKTKERYDQVELDILGMDHAEIGAYLLDQWNIPILVGQSVLHHHRYREAEPAYAYTAAVIHVAEVLCSNHNLRHRLDPPVRPLEEDAIAQARLNPALLQKVEKFVDEKAVHCDISL